MVLGSSPTLKKGLNVFGSSDHLVLIGEDLDKGL